MTRNLPGPGRQAALVVGASLPPRPGWRDLAGRCWHARPQPQALHQPTRHLSRPHGRRLIQSGRLRWLHRLPPAVSRHATASTGPRFHEDGQTARPGIQEGHHDRAERELRRQPHRPTRLRHTEGGIARAMFRVAVSRRREQEASFFTVVVWRDQAEHAAESLVKGSRVVVVGRLQQRAWTAEDGSAARPSRSWRTSWGRASLVHLRCGACLECRRTRCRRAIASEPGLDQGRAQFARSDGPDALSGNRATR